MNTHSIPAALLLGATLAAAPPALLAQSATDESGKPVATEGVAGDQAIVGTDGLVRYANPEEMWQTISSNWETLGEQASGRWTEIDAQALMDTEGDKDALVSLVSESYGIPEEQAEQEVTAWATNADDGM